MELVREEHGVAFFGVVGVVVRIGRLCLEVVARSVVVSATDVPHFVAEGLRLEDHIARVHSRRGATCASDYVVPPPIVSTSPLSGPYPGAPSMAL